MKNIFDILSDFEITIPEESKRSFEHLLNANYKTAAETKKLREKNQLLSEQLKTANESLCKFNGINVHALIEEIENLKDTLSMKDNEYQNKILSIEFEKMLDTAIMETKAKNRKAVRALLDVDMLKSSTNRENDIRSSLEKIKQENGYLFESGVDLKSNRTHRKNRCRKCKRTCCFSYSKEAIEKRRNET